MFILLPLLVAGTNLAILATDGNFAEIINFEAPQAKVPAKITACFKVHNFDFMYESIGHFSPDPFFYGIQH